MIETGAVGSNNSDLIEWSTAKSDILSAMRSGKEGMIWTDTEGRVKFIDPRAQTMTGWRHSDASGKHVGDVLGLPEQANDEELRACLEQVICTGDAVESTRDVVVVAKDGSHRLIRLRCGPMTDEDGAVVGALVLLHRRV